ncbi:cytochrome P450 11B, mitochondrial-like [Dryobates pubescens]|uniref:cytochrome P450 11B, mitochondrial-like n=1 Tax=Dryobates pubescens TaxID=118200 RepID=UPI0023B96F48|nr:cytochrome P450 11B, mitochondrial-like [Dryobates pubescens]
MESSLAHGSTGDVGTSRAEGDVLGVRSRHGDTRDKGMSWGQGDALGVWGHHGGCGDPRDTRDMGDTEGTQRGRRSLSGGVKPYEAIPRDGANRWLNLYRLWRDGGFQHFHHHMEKTFQKLGPIYRDRVGSYECVNVLLPRDAAQLFRAEGTFPRRMGIEAWSTHRQLRNHQKGLFLLNGPAWRSDRLALNPALLSPAAGRHFAWLLDVVAQDFVRGLRRRLERSPGGALTLDLHPLIFRFTLEASTYALYGERLGLLGGGLTAGGAEKFLAALETMLSTTLPLLFVPPSLLRRINPPLWRDHLAAWDVIFQHAGGLLGELLLQGQLPLGSVKANVTEFTAGGVDTTAVPLLFTLLELGRNPGVQRELREELLGGPQKEGVPGPPPKPRPLPELLGELPLLRAAIKETLRLYPVGITVQRYPATDVVLHNYHVPAGTLCQVALYALGRSPEVFSNPQHYDPKRWLLKEASSSFRAVAFGFGARQCIGRRLAEVEMMLFLGHVLRNFTVEAVSTEDIPTVFRFILMPEKPPLLTLRALD